MSKAIIDENTLTSLADKIRVLNGTEDTMTPDEMNSELTNANNEVEAQSALIDQLSEMLDGKAVGGGDNGVETCTISFIDAADGECFILSATATIFENGKQKTYVFECNTYNVDERVYKLTISNVVCGTPINIVFRGSYMHGKAYIEINGTAIYEGESEHYDGGTYDVGYHSVSFTSPTSANENCTIYYAYQA